ncbi:MAG TPA: hypothetical protein VKA87_01940 [Nitrososphaeraceae archaeon]|nr:hypothetical protein [Nitrososphaeraceae archaeon]
MLLISAFGSSSYAFFLASPYNVQQEIASTSVESNVIISDKINFTTPEVSILYPVNWNAVKGTFQGEETNSIITFRLLPQNDTDDALAILNIASYDLGRVNITTEQYADGQLLFLRGTIPDFQLIQFNKTTLAGRPAYQIVYSGLEGTGETKTMKLWVVDQSSFGSTVYMITYSTKPENYRTHFASAKEMINSFAIQEKVGRAPAGELLDAELLEYIPEPSRQELGNITKLPSFESILGGSLTNLIDFIKGSTNTALPNFARLPTHPESNIAIHYHLSSAYLNPTNNMIYAALALIFTDNSTNRVLPEPLDYEVKINGSNFNFNENGSTSTGLDIKILNGTSLEEALKNNQEYKLGIDILNINRTSFEQRDEMPIGIAK